MKAYEAWLALVALTTSTGLAQETGATAIRNLCAALASDDTRVVAKAAADARLVVERAVTQVLQRTLDRWAKDDRDNAEVVRLFLLDALIEHEAKVPGDPLLPMLDARLTEIPALVLLVREPAMNEALLLEQFAQRYSTRGIAQPPAGGMLAVTLADPRRSLLGNVLSGRRAKGFAAILWKQANLTLQVRAQDPQAGAHGSISFGLPELRPEEPVEGFPRLPVYRLSEQRPQTDPAKRLLQDARPSKTLLTNWPTRIEFSREGAAQLPIDLSWQGAEPEAEWLAVMAGETRDTLRGLRHLSVTYSTDAKFVAEVTAARAALETARKALRDTLVARGALTADEAKTCDVAVEIVLDDQRGDRSKPLPEIPAAR